MGACRVRRRHGDRIETATFATTVRHFDPVERKPLYHYRPGRSALTLAAPGCTFACDYCLNYRLSQVGRMPELPWQAEPVDPADIVAEATAAGSSIALSYSEPTLAAELTLALAELARPHGIELLWKTNGFITPEALSQVAPCLNAINLDLKAATDNRHRELTTAPVTPVLDALAGFVAAGVWVEVSTPLIPGFNDDDASLRTIAGWIASVSRQIPWHLLRFTPEFRMQELNPTPPATLRRAADIGRDLGLDFVYVERALGDDGRSTKCPRCRAVVVTRDIWKPRQVSLIEGACPACRLSIAGRW